MYMSVGIAGLAGCANPFFVMKLSFYFNKLYSVFLVTLTFFLWRNEMIDRYSSPFLYPLLRNSRKSVEKKQSAQKKQSSIVRFVDE